MGWSAKMVLGSAVALVPLLFCPAALTFGSRPPSPARGYQLLITKPYLPPDFDQETFDRVWKTWEEPLRSKAEQATPEERRHMAYLRYGLLARQGDPQGRPIQYVVDSDGNWYMNCLACHQGQVGNRILAGTPNTNFALATLTEEIRATKQQMGKVLSRMDIGSMFMPLGTTNGTTNAVMFGVVLMHYRDADLNIHAGRLPPRMTHHDHDAPPWWNVKKKKNLYSDGFAPKGHRALMQFLLVKENGPEKFRQWEQDFRDIEAYIESLSPPKYPFAVDHRLAQEGEKVFRHTCAECHGNYGPDGHYPETIVPIDVVNTDPVRLDALTRMHREDYEASWFANYGEDKAIVEPGGYVAPPLDGIWASAPYLHNGSVPTLWHLLRPKHRPVVWRRVPDGYDPEKLGLVVTTVEEIPAEVKSTAKRRQYFDTRGLGKRASGHDFPEQLRESEKQSLLEYLKTL